ncbi:MAG: hypothetical protein OHK0029_28310 [Armatimonadaceae bacterium]
MIQARLSRSRPWVAAAVLTALVTASSGTAALAQAKRPSTLPPVSQSKPINLPKITQETLPNGMRLVVLENHEQPAVWMQLALPAGTIRDPQDKVGLAAMTADLLNKGTRTRSEGQIADLIDGLGANLSASVDDDYFFVATNGLSSYTDTLLQLLADVTLNPTFPEPEVNRYKTRTLSAIQSSLAEAASVATASFNRLVYGAHPYGNYSLGSLQTVPKLTQADVRGFHETFFAPNAATLFVVGDITPKQAREKVEKAFAGWQKKDIPAAPAAPKPMGGEAGDGKPQIYIIDRPGAEQTEIRIGQLTQGYNDPDRIEDSVASIVLGGGGFQNRLMQEIRVKRGLTYGANSVITRNKDAGQFYISTFTKNASTGETVRVALEEVKKLRENPPSPTELRERQTFLTGFVNVSMATPAGVLARLVPAILYGEGPEDLQEFNTKVMAVTPKDVQETFQNLPVARDYVVLVGEAKTVEPQVKEIGPVTVIPQNELNLLSADLRGKPEAAKPSENAAEASPEAKAAGKALLMSVVEAHGGAEFLKLNSLGFQGTGKLTTPPSQGSIEIPIDEAKITSALPGKVRFDLKTVFGEITVGSPGGDAGTWIQFSGQVQEQPNPDGSGAGDPVTLILKTVRENWDVAAIPDTMNAPDGKKLKAFRVLNEKGRPFKVFVEDDTNLVRRVEFTGVNGTVLFELANYQTVNGKVKLPASYRQAADGQELFNLTFNSFTLNPEVKDTMFQKPTP